MRRFVMGDIHGAYKALMQCFDRSAFNPDNDMLICLGDLCDGWPETDKVLNELCMIRNLILILGNHDRWLADWFKTGIKPESWIIQGGAETILSFRNGINESHRSLMTKARLYYQLDNKLFVHGGFHTIVPIEHQDEKILIWDRTLVKTALHHRLNGHEVKLTPYDMVYVGHTPTINFNEPEPVTTCGICMMDTGAGWPGGKLTIMDIDSGQHYQSDRVDNLYVRSTGRLY